MLREILKVTRSSGKIYRAVVECLHKVGSADDITITNLFGTFYLYKMAAKINWNEITVSLSSCVYLAISQAATLRPRLGIQPMPLCGSEHW